MKIIRNLINFYNIIIKIMRRELILYKIKINNITKKIKKNRIKINIIIIYFYDYIKRYTLALIKKLFEV